MSSALALASVTSVLKDLLDNWLVQQVPVAGLGDVTVSTLPPDRITTGADERSQLNIFLYRVTPQLRWRQSNGDGQAPLALDLHYLISAYGEADFHAEILLGYAIQLLHDTPVLSRERIKEALHTSRNGGRGRQGARSALAASTLGDQTEEILIKPEFLSAEDTSKLWSALQGKYRPSATYTVSAVLIGSVG